MQRHASRDQVGCQCRLPSGPKHLLKSIVQVDTEEVTEEVEGKAAEAVVEKAGAAASPQVGTVKMSNAFATKHIESKNSFFGQLLALPPQDGG